MVGVQEHAAGALVNLCLCDASCKPTIVTEGVIPHLVTLLRSPWVGVQGAAAGVLKCLATNVADTDYANGAAITAAGGVAPLVALLKSPSTVVQRNAVSALSMVSYLDVNKVAIPAAGGIPPLVALLGSSDRGTPEAAISSLLYLATNVSNAVTIAAAGGIRSLIALLGHHAGPVAALILCMLASDVDGGVAGASAALSARGITPLVEVLTFRVTPVRARGARALQLLTADAKAVAVMRTRESLDALRRVLSETTDEVVRDSVASALRALGAHSSTGAAAAPAPGPGAVRARRGGAELDATDDGGGGGDGDEAVGIVSMDSMVFLMTNMDGGLARASAMLSARGIAPLIVLLASRVPAARTSGARALQHLLSGDAKARAVMRTRESLDALRRVLSETTDEVVRDSVASALRALCV